MILQEKTEEMNEHEHPSSLAVCLKTCACAIVAAICSHQSMSISDDIVCLFVCLFICLFVNPPHG